VPGYKPSSSRIGENKKTEQAFHQIKRKSLIFLSIRLISVIPAVQASLTLHYQFKSPWLKHDQRVGNRRIVIKYYACLQPGLNYFLITIIPEVSDLMKR